MRQKIRHPLSVLGFVVALTLGTCVFAQALPPFYGGPVTAFDVEVGIIDSGTLLDAQAVVSQDRRYVTINTQATNTALLALQEFQTQAIAVGGSGFVGGADPSSHFTSSVPHTLPSEIDRADRDAVSVLNRRGVFLLAPLK
jgi:hypothetical protein